MSTLHIILAAAAVWRLTHMFQREDGPFAVFDRVRRQLRHASLQGAVDCFYCLSIWVAVPFAAALARSLPEFVLMSLALSAFAILIDRLVSPAESHAIYFEQPEAKENSSCPVVEMHAAQKRN